MSATSPAATEKFIARWPTPMYSSLPLPNSVDSGYPEIIRQFLRKYAQIEGKRPQIS